MFDNIQHSVHHLFVLHQELSLIMKHLAGPMNAKVDELGSRCLADNDWCLHHDVAQGIFQQWGEPWLDLCNVESQKF